MTQRISTRAAIGLALCLSVFGLGSAHAANEELAAEVKDAIAEEFAKDPDLKAVKINDLTLIQKTENTYRGLLEISDSEGSEKLSVNVSVDDDNFIWEIE